MKSDPGPVLKRLPGLRGVASVSWMSGTVGDPAVPGPSTYWIDAMVTLDAGAAQRLRDLATGPATPSGLAEQLRGSVPAGELRTSSALNQALPPVTGWTVQAAISADQPVLVIAALGQ